MRAIFKKPLKDLGGYLVWATPYIFDQLKLNDSIERLKQFNYEIRPYNDTGIFIQSKKESKPLTLKIIKSLFHWMDIAIESFDIDSPTYENFIFKSQTVLLPISRLEIHEPIYAEYCCIYPPGYLRINKMNFGKLNRINPENKKKEFLRDEINKTTRFNISKLDELPLAVISSDISFEEYTRMRHLDDNDFIRKCIDKVENLLDIVRLEHCNYTVPGYLPSRAGKYYDRYSVAAIYFPQYRIGFWQSRQIDIKTISTGVGVQIHDSNSISNHPLNVLIKGEIGFIFQHALKLHSQIQESDNESVKFTQIITLWEFLGNPNEYKKISQSKKILFATIANDQSEYDKLKLRVEELTAGFKNDEGKRIPPGFRTAIIHNGRSILELIPTSKERKLLFEECYRITIRLLSFIEAHLEITWEEFQEVRLNLRNRFH